VKRKTSKPRMTSNSHEDPVGDDIFGFRILDFGLRISDFGFGFRISVSVSVSVSDFSFRKVSEKNVQFFAFFLTKIISRYPTHFPTTIIREFSHVLCSGYNTGIYGRWTWRDSVVEDEASSSFFGRRVFLSHTEEGRVPSSLRRSKH